MGQIVSGTALPVSLDSCASRALESLDLRIAESAAVITRDPLPVVIGVAALLEGLYQNLLSNALKFTAPGQPPCIHLSAERALHAEGRRRRGRDLARRPW